MSNRAVQAAWRVHARPLLSLRDWHQNNALKFRSVWTETPEEGQLSFYDSTVEQVGMPWHDAAPPRWDSH